MNFLETSVLRWRTARLGLTAEESCQFARLIQQHGYAYAVLELVDDQPERLLRYCSSFRDYHEVARIAVGLVFQTALGAMVQKARRFEEGLIVLELTPKGVDFDRRLAELAGTANCYVRLMDIWPFTLDHPDTRAKVKEKLFNRARELGWGPLLMRFNPGELIWQDAFIEAAGDGNEFVLAQCQRRWPEYSDWMRESRNRSA